MPKTMSLWTPTILHPLLRLVGLTLNRPIAPLPRTVHAIVHRIALELHPPPVQNGRQCLPSSTTPVSGTLSLAGTVSNPEVPESGALYIYGLRLYNTRLRTMVTTKVMGGLSLEEGLLVPAGQVNKHPPADDPSIGRLGSKGPIPEVQQGEVMLVSRVKAMSRLPMMTIRTALMVILVQKEMTNVDVLALAIDLTFKTIVVSLHRERRITSHLVDSAVSYVPSP